MAHPPRTTSRSFTSQTREFVTRHGRARLPTPSYVPPIADRVAGHRCCCDVKGRGPSQCPWHLGRYTVPPREDEGIPRIRGISSGAWLAFVMCWRGVVWASETEAKDGYAPGYRRLARGIGGRNERTRPKDEFGRPGIGPRWEKGICDLSTVVAYMAELRAARLPDGSPLVVVKRRPNRCAWVWVNPQCLWDAPEQLTVTLAWDHPCPVSSRPATISGTSVPAPTPTPFEPSGLESSESNHLKPPHGMGVCIPSEQADVGSRELPPATEDFPHAQSCYGLTELASREPWWRRWAELAGGEKAARDDMRRVARLLDRDGIPREQLVAAMRLLTHQWEKGHKEPQSFAAWLLWGARKGVHIRPDKSLAELAVEIQQQEQLARSHAAIDAAGESPSAEALVERQMTDEELESWKAEQLAILGGGRAAPPVTMTPRRS